MTEFNDREHILNGRWDTCCVKKRPTGDERPDFMGYSAFGVLTTGRSRPIVIYLRAMARGERDFARTKTYEDVDAMLADGWVVD
jgi:hypothetical protein